MFFAKKTKSHSLSVKEGNLRTCFPRRNNGIGRERMKSRVRMAIKRVPMSFKYGDQKYKKLESFLTEGLKESPSSIIHYSQLLEDHRGDGKNESDFNEKAKKEKCLWYTDDEEDPKVSMFVSPYRGDRMSFWTPHGKPTLDAFLESFEFTIPSEIQQQNEFSLGFGQVYEQHCPSINEYFTKVLSPYFSGAKVTEQEQGSIFTVTNSQLFHQHIDSKSKIYYQKLAQNQFHQTNIRSLSLKESQNIIGKYWASSQKSYTISSESQSLVDALVLCKPTSGVFIKKQGQAEAEEELAAWILTKYDGSLGMLVTLPEYRGMGIGTMVMRDLVRKFEETNRLPFWTVVYDNTVARNMYSQWQGVTQNDKDPLHWFAMVFHK